MPLFAVGYSVRHPLDVRNLISPFLLFLPFSSFPYSPFFPFSVALGFQFYYCFPFFLALVPPSCLSCAPSFHSCSTVAPSSTFCYWVRLIYGFISLSCGNFASQCSYPLPLILLFNAIYHVLFSVFPTACLLLKCCLYPLFTFLFTLPPVQCCLSWATCCWLFFLWRCSGRLDLRLNCRYSFYFFSLLFPIKSLTHFSNLHCVQEKLFFFYNLLQSLSRLHHLIRDLQSSQRNASVFCTTNRAECRREVANFREFLEKNIILINTL